MQGFDLVIFDRERIAVRIDAVMLGELGWPLTEPEVVERFVDRSEAYMVEQIELALGRSLAPGWHARYQRLHREAFEAEFEPVDGVVEALDAIHAPVCVASSSTHERCATRSA